MQLTRPTALIAIVLALALAMVMATAASAQVASLIGPDETPTPDPARVAETELEFADREEALLAFAACMRDNGVDMDDPQIGGGRGFFRGGPGGPARPDFDVASPEFQSAQEACGPILEAARPEIDPEAQAELLEQQLALAQCLRDNGIEGFPDPAIGTDGRLQRGGGQAFAELGIDRRSEAFQKAQETCLNELGIEFGPGRFGPGGGD